jgi:ferritin-like metal-binding protein YciE
MATTAKSTSTRRSKSHDPKSALLNFFVDEIKDIYWAEKHLIKALPKMKKAATSPELQEAFEAHLQQTQEHVARLEEVFSMVGEKPQAKKCEAMEGLLEEGEKVIQHTEDGSATRDVGLIVSAQKVEHYEIAAYGGLAQLAKTLGRDDIKEILGTTLSEEKHADELLTEIAESNINYEASEEREGT